MPCLPGNWILCFNLQQAVQNALVSLKLPCWKIIRTDLRKTIVNQISDFFFSLFFQGSCLVQLLAKQLNVKQIISGLGVTTPGSLWVLRWKVLLWSTSEKFEWRNKNGLPQADGVKFVDFLRIKILFSIETFVELHAELLAFWCPYDYSFS